MKTLLKSCLLLALIIGGKLAKEAPPVAVAAKTEVSAPDDIILVHRVLTSEPVPAPTPVANYAKLRETTPPAVSAF